MRVCYRLIQVVLVVVASLVAVRYSCENYNDGSLSICKYTAPERYQKLLEERFPAVVQYGAKVNEKYQTAVVPFIKDAAVQFEQKVLPRAKQVGQSAIEFSENEVYPRCIRYSLIIKGRTLHLCESSYQLYLVRVKPCVAAFYYQTLQKYPSIEHYIFQLRARFALVRIHVVKYYTIVSRNARFYNEHYGFGRLQKLEMYQQVRRWVVEEVAVCGTYIKERVSTWWREVSHQSKLEEDDDSIFYDDEDDAEETITQTSTIVVTYTASESDSQVGLKPTDPNRELEVSVEELVRDEFSAWKQAIKNKATNTIADFENDINEFADAKLREVTPEFSDLMKRASNTSQINFQIITKGIMDINCTEGVDPETNESIWFDQNGTQLPRYMTRELMREFFTSAHSQFDILSSQIRSHLKELANEVNSQVEVLRQEHIELYEEWADVMITEWSKRLAYVDVVVNEENKEALDKEQRQNWKEYMKLKRQVIETRDILLEHPVKLESLQTFVNTIQQSLKALSHENGEYLYILRSKANLEFQAREALERQQQQAKLIQESELEEPSSTDSTAETLIEQLITSSTDDTLKAKKADITAHEHAEDL